MSMHCLHCHNSSSAAQGVNQHEHGLSHPQLGCMMTWFTCQLHCCMYQVLAAPMFAGGCRPMLSGCVAVLYLPAEQQVLPICSCLYQGQVPKPHAAAIQLWLEVV